MASLSIITIMGSVALGFGLSAMPGSHYVVFQDVNDVMGIANGFESGDGLPDGDFTISMMQKFSGLRGTRSSLVQYGYDLFFAISTVTNGASWGLSCDFDGKAQRFDSSMSLDDQDLADWHVYTFVFNKADSQLSAFLDGQLHQTVSTDNSSKAGVFAKDMGVQTLYWGMSGNWENSRGRIIQIEQGKQGFVGGLARVAIWNRALSNSEVSTGWNAPLSGSEPGLAIYYDMSEGAGTTLHNLGSAGSKYNGVLGAYASVVNPGSTNELDGCPETLTTSPVWAATAGHPSANAVPQLAELRKTLVEGSPNGYQWLPNGQDADGDPLFYAITALPRHGILYEVNALADYDVSNLVQIAEEPHTQSYPFTRFLYIPDGNNIDPDSIEVQASDGTGTSPRMAVHFRFNAQNDPPTSSDLNLTGSMSQPLLITLPFEDVDTEHVAWYITQRPSYGTLYMEDGDTSVPLGEGEIYSEVNRVAPFEQYASKVLAISSFWPAGDELANGFPSWHPFQITGPPDVSAYGDIPQALAFSTMNGEGGQDAGSDNFLSYDFNPTANFLETGWSEFIELEFEEAVYVQSVVIGEVVGMGAIVSTKIWNNATQSWYTMWSRFSGSNEEFEKFEQLQVINAFQPSPICQPPFMSKRLRIEFDTATINAWNEYDYVKLIGAKTLPKGISTNGRVKYVPDDTFCGIDSFEFKVGDCGFIDQVAYTSSVQMVSVSVPATSQPCGKTFACPSGQSYSRESDECVECDAGRYSPGLGKRTVCEPCSVGRQSPGKGSICTECKGGSFAEETGMSECREHPEVGTDKYSTVDFVLTPGYWRTMTNPYSVVRCNVQAGCIGGNSSSLCAVGHKGPICAVCDDEHYAQKDGSCSRCDGGAASAMFILGIVIIGLLLGITIAVVARAAFKNSGGEETSVFGSSRNETSFVHQSTGVAQERNKVVNMLVSFWQIVGKVVTLQLNFTQIAGKVSSVYYISWPAEYAAMLSVMGIFTFDLMGSMPLACMMEYNYHAQLRMTLVGPLVINVCFALSRQGLLKIGKTEAALKVVKPWMLFNYLAYINICSTCFMTIPCHEMPDGTRWLRADYSIDCTSDAHRIHVVLAIIGTVVYTFGIPAVIFILLWRNRALIGPGRTEESAAKVAHLSMFFECYRPEVWWSECIVCAQKCTIAGVLVFIPKSTLQLALGLLVSIGWLAYYSFVIPYKIPAHNYIVILMNACLCCIMLCGLLLNVDGDGYDPSALNIILILVTIVPIVATMLYVFKAAFDVNKIRTAAPSGGGPAPTQQANITENDEEDKSGVSVTFSTVKSHDV